jgi:hypothetical protein
MVVLSAVTQATSGGRGWELAWSQLTFVKVLGAGQFGEVQLMQTSSGASQRQLVAVKTLRDPVCSVFCRDARAGWHRALRAPVTISNSHLHHSSYPSTRRRRRSSAMRWA